MLNELSLMSRSLSSRGIRTQTWHPWLQTFRKGEALVAELDVDGIVAGVSLLTQEEVANLHKIAPDFHNSFPGFNLNCPLLTISDPVAWNQPDALWGLALATNDSSPLAYQGNDLRRLRRLLGEFPRLELAPRLVDGSSKLDATLALLDRLASAGNRPEVFLHQLALQLVTMCQQGRSSRDLVLSILFGKPNKKRQRLDEWKTTLILDVADLSNFSYRVADPAVAIEWSNSLIRSERVASQRAFSCALSGQLDTPVDNKLPNPNLPLLGPTYLMSMNADAPCQTRYGQTSTGIFRVGRKSVQELNDAILAMTHSSRHDKTWTGVPSAFKDQSDLLVAYLEEQPDANVGVVSLFADSEADSATAFATFESRTADVYTALRGLNSHGRDQYIHVLALSKIDPGRKQVIFAGCYSTSAVYEGRDTWLTGTRNIPDIAIRFPVAKGRPAVYYSAYQPSPAELMLSFKRQWLRSGQDSHQVPGVELRRIYQLYLDPDAAKQATWLMERYIPLTTPLLVGLGRFLLNGTELSESARKQALIVIAGYGILLFRQGRTKEIYMEDRDYLLGEFLKFADLLHKLYCQHERGGSIPPQLIGNAAIPMAMQSPRRALEVLSTRMTVYLAWAERFSGESAGLARWTRKELGRIAGLLKEKDLDMRVSSNGKAELLLGYLASAKEKENTEEKVS